MKFRSHWSDDQLEEEFPAAAHLLVGGAVKERHLALDGPYDLHDGRAILLDR